MQGVVPVLVRVGARAVATSLFSADLMSLPFPYTLTLVLIVKVQSFRFVLPHPQTLICSAKLCMPRKCILDRIHSMPMGASSAVCLYEVDYAGSKVVMYSLSAWI